MAISATPSQTDAVSPTTPHKSDAIKRWQKLHNTHKAVHLLNHEVKHEFAHRAQEKAFFGLANQGLARARNTLVRTAKPQHALVETAARSNAIRKWWLGMVKHTKRALKAVRRVGKKAVPADAVAHSAEHALFSLHTLFHAIHVVLPLLGTYLIAHMAHHDLHRAQDEYKSKGAFRLTTSLFFIGFVCDALDALAHFVIVLCLTLPESTYLNHHVEHTLHEYSMYAALIAALAMMSGHALSPDGGGGHGHHDTHGGTHSHDQKKLKKEL